MALEAEYTDLQRRFDSIAQDWRASQLARAGEPSPAERALEAEERYLAFVQRDLGPLVSIDDLAEARRLRLTMNETREAWLNGDR